MTPNGSGKAWLHGVNCVPCSISASVTSIALRYAEIVVVALPDHFATEFLLHRSS